MHRTATAALLTLLTVTPGCFVAKDATPHVGIGADLASKFVHRGMTQVDKPVLNPKLAVVLPTESGDDIRLNVEGNVDLSNDTGDAWFPDGHAGRFTDIEMVAAYTRKVGDVTLRGGIHSYNLPNGQEFRNGERGGTNELFVLASADVLETNPYFSVNYDFDEVKAAYYRAGISEDIPLGEKWKLSLDGSLGYAATEQAFWLYGIRDPGFADLRGEAVLKWQYDDRTELDAGIHGSTIVDRTIKDWFSNLGIDSSPIWFSIGISWQI